MFSNAVMSVIIKQQYVLKKSTHILYLLYSVDLQLDISGEYSNQIITKIVIIIKVFI